MFDIPCVVPDAAEECSVPVRLHPGREREAVVKRQHLGREEVILPIEEQSSVVKRIWVVLLDRQLTGTTEELHDPVVRRSIEQLHVGVLPATVLAVIVGEVEVSNDAFEPGAEALWVSADLLETGWAEVEADIGTWRKHVPGFAELTVHAVLISVLTGKAVQWAVATAVLLGVVPLVIAARTCVTWTSVGLDVAADEVVVAHLFHAWLAGAWRVVNELPVLAAKLTLVLSSAGADVATLCAAAGAVLWWPGVADITLTAARRQLWVGSMRTAEAGDTVLRLRPVTALATGMASVVTRLIIFTAKRACAMAVNTATATNIHLPVLTSRSIDKHGCPTWHKRGRQNVVVELANVAFGEV